MENDNLVKYQFYIRKITDEINKMFDYQKEYICCKEGCSACCEYGEYPFSQVEFEYLKIGYHLLPLEIRVKVNEKIKKLLDENKNTTEVQINLHECPFLIDGRCSVYDYRGIICRTFGLIIENSEGKWVIPFCADRGLNYSNVYDKKNEKLLEDDEVLDLGYKVLPKTYNLNRNNLMNLSLVKKLELNFGESKRLIDWLKTIES